MKAVNVKFEIVSPFQTDESLSLMMKFRVCPSVSLNPLKRRDIKINFTLKLHTAKDTKL